MAPLSITRLLHQERIVYGLMDVFRQQKLSRRHGLFERLMHLNLRIQ
jgi:hypothetical protein